MSRETLRVFLVVACILGICLAGRRGRGRGVLKRGAVRTSIKDAVKQPAKNAAVTGSAVNAVKNMELPNWEDLMNGLQETKDGMKYNYKGCEISVSNTGDVINLDLSSAKCKDAVSLSDLFAKFTGKKSEADRFVSLDKFNVDSVRLDKQKQDLSFSTSSKEPFQLLKGINLKVGGKLSMDFNYKSLKFIDVGIHLSGELTIGSSKILYTLEKKRGSEEGKFVLSSPKIKVGDFYKGFTGSEALDDESKSAKTGIFTDISIDQPMIRGTRDAKGNSELILTGAATGIPGVGKGSFVVVLSALYGESANVGVIVKFNEISPATILTKLTGLDLKAVPIINDITLDIIIEYANSEIVPADKEALKIVKDFSPTGCINEGTKLKFFLPFKKLLEKQGVSVPVGTNLDQYIFVIMKDSKISFEFPNNAAMDLLNILIAFIPNFGTGLFEKVFSRVPKVKFIKFEVDVRNAAVDIAIESTGKMTLGNKFLSLDAASFTLQHKPDGPWDFSFSAQKSVGRGNLGLSVRKEGDVYTLEGTIDMISTADIAHEMKVDSTAAKVLNTIKSLNFGLTGVKVAVQFGKGLKVMLKGTAQFLRWSATFEGHVIETKEGTNAMAFGIVITNVGVSELSKAMFETPNKKLDIRDASWLSNVTAGIIVANKAATDEVKFEDKNLKNARKPDNDGVVFYASVDIPEDCRDDKICEFLQRHLGTRQKFFLNGIIQRDLIAIEAGFEGSIKIGDRYSIEKAMFSLKAGFTTPPVFCISGTMRVKMPKSDDSVLFTATLGLDASLTVTLSLEMKGAWRNPFGINNLEVANFKMDAGINLISAMPSFGLSGIIRIGSSASVIEAKLAGGFELPGKFYFYCQVSNLTVASILEAFDITVDSLPDAVKESGFPEGLVAGLSLPTGKKLKNLKVDLEPGFFLQGVVNILGYQIDCEVRYKLPATFSLKAKFDKLELAGGAIKLRSVDDENSGPEIAITISATSMPKILIDAYIEVLGIGIGAKIEISDRGFFFKVTGNFLGLFTVTIDVSAPYRKSLTGGGKSEWKVSGCLGASVSQQAAKGAGDDVKETADNTKEAEKETDEISGESGSWYEKAQAKVRKYTERLKLIEAEFVRKITKLAKKKKDLKEKCVRKCEKERVIVGGLGETDYDLGNGNSVRVPYWNDRKYIRDDPYCLGKCKSGFFKKIGGAIKGGVKLLEFKIMERVRKFYAKLLGSLAVFVVRSKKLFDYAQAGVQKLKEIKDKGVALLKAAGKWIGDNLIAIEKICMNTVLKDGVCFGIEAKFYIGGRKRGKLIDLKEEICFSTSWAVELGKKIAKKAFPSIDAMKDRFKQLKGILFGSKEESKNIEKESKDVESAESEEEESERRTLQKADESEYPADILGADPEFVMRDDATIRAFRDLFFSDDDVVYTRSEISEAGSADDEASGNPSGEDSPVVSALEIDPVALSKDASKCRRAQAVINAYDSVSASINGLVKHNRKAKESYENFTQSFANRFDELEQVLRADARMSNMSEPDTGEMLYYVTYGKEGVANWKRQFAQKFDSLDRSSLQNWRTLVAKHVADKKLDIDAFLKLLKSASREAAKKWEVPGHENEMQLNLTYAEQVLQKLLTSDDDPLLSKEPSVKGLVEVVRNMRSLRSSAKCDQQVSA